MLFYKLQARIPGVEIPQDRQERSGFAQELQPKQELFYQKQNRRMYFCICQWKKNQVVMAAISQENQDIASFGAAFLQSMDLPAQNIVPEEICCGRRSAMIFWRTTTICCANLTFGNCSTAGGITRKSSFSRTAPKHSCCKAPKKSSVKAP